MHKTIAAILLLGTLASGCGGGPSATAMSPSTNPEAKNSCRECKALHEDFSRVWRQWATLTEEQRLASEKMASMQSLLQLPLQWRNRLAVENLDFRADPPWNAIAMAEADVAAGHLNILTGGLNRYWGEPTAVLEEKYGIVVMHIAGCTGPRQLFDMMDTYNKVSEEAIEKKHGPDFFDRFWKEMAARPASAP